MSKLASKPSFALIAGLLTVAGIHAKVPQQEADRLGRDLTCTGAIQAGNKDGSIPAFTNKWLGAPPGVTYQASSGQHPPISMPMKRHFFISRQRTWSITSPS